MDDKLMTVAELNAQVSDAFNSMPVVALIGLVLIVAFIWAWIESL